MIKIKFFFSSTLFYLLFILLLILYTFWRLPQTFYQQDEWLGLGQVLAFSWESVSNGYSPIGLFMGEGRPLTRIFGVLIFGNFPYDSLSLSIYSIGFHFLNSILVFFIALRLLKKNYLALISSLFFAINNVTHQSVTWFAASFGLQPATTLILLSIFAFIRFVEKENKKFLYLSFISVILSLYFKENGVFLFLFLPVIPFLLGKKINFKRYSKQLVPLIVFIFIFASYRLLEMLSGSYVSNSVYASISNQNILVTLVTRFIMYPLTSFSLIYIPYPISTFLTFSFLDAYYPFIVNRPDLVAYTVVLDMLAIIGSFLIFIFLYFIGKDRKETKKVIIFSLLFFFLSLLPYIVISKTYAYMEPRYYYIASIPAGFLLALITRYLIEKINKRKLGLILIILFFSFYLLSQIMPIKKDIVAQVIVASERRLFLKQLNSLLPTLNKDENIFYFTGDRSWYVEKNKIPFQHGFGHSIMVLYLSSEKIPKQLLSTEYLWGLGEEGYRKIGNKSYGYFNDIENLKKTVKENNINPDNIHAFYYKSEDLKLLDISENVRRDLEN